MIKISLLDKLNNSNYNWWKVSPRIQRLLVQNGCIQVNNRVVTDLNTLIPKDAWVKRVFRNRDLGNTEYNHYLEGFYSLKRKPLNSIDLQGNGTKDRTLINVRRDTSSQFLFKNKKYLKDYYKIKNHEIDSISNLESRLDVIVVRLGMADCLDTSRHLIKNSLILVDSKKVNKINFLVNIGQVITSVEFLNSKQKRSYSWLYRYDSATFGCRGILITTPKRSEVELPKRILTSLL